MSSDRLDDYRVDDDALAAAALAADPDVTVDDDAESLWEFMGLADHRVLPLWYMPPPVPGTPLLRGWRRSVVFAVIAAFLAITASGLCNTYGDIFTG